jgi:predicted nucleic acid-binding protein
VAVVPDLLVAVVAEVHRVPVLHYDDDFHRVAAITGQPVEWVVGRGAVT